MQLKLILVMATASLPLQAHAVDLHLRCEGTAATVHMNSASGTISGPGIGNEANVSMSGLSSERSAQRLRVQLSESTGRIQVPPVMVPPLRSGGSEGWWPLYELEVSDNEIPGRYRLNPINKPTVRIDRISGDIDIQGKGARFVGTCQPEERDPANRKF